MTEDLEQIDWDRICLSSPVGPYAEPVAALSSVKLGGGVTPAVLPRRSHLRTFRVVEWGNGPQHTTTYVAIAEFTPGLSSSRSEVELSKFTTMPSRADELIFDGRVSYGGWRWTPEFFDSISRLERRLAIRSLDVLNDFANPGWSALRETALCELVPFASKYPAREYVLLLVSALDRLVNFWARVLRLKWYLGQGLCAAMLDPSSIEYPKYHPIDLHQIEEAIGAFGSPIVIAASFALSLRRPSMEATVREARQNGLLAELVQIENHDLTEHVDTTALDFREVEIPVVYGDVTRILSGNLSSSDLTDSVPISVADCDESTKTWLEGYARGVIGSSPDERRTRFDANFPELGSFSCLDEVASLSTLRYLRRSDFPSRYDWYAFIASEVFEHRFGVVALLDDLRRYVTQGLAQLGSVWGPTLDTTHAGHVLSSLDSAQQELAACQVMIGEIELHLQEVVVSMLKHKFGPDGIDWYDKGVPDKIQDRVEEKWDQGGTLPPERCLDLLHYKAIMKENWSLFRALFVESDAPEPTANRSLRWIGKLNQVRLDLAHPSRRGRDWLATEGGRNAKANLSDWLNLASKLKQRCDEYLA